MGIQAENDSARSTAWKWRAVGEGEVILFGPLKPNLAGFSRLPIFSRDDFLAQILSINYDLCIFYAAPNKGLFKLLSVRHTPLTNTALGQKTVNVSFASSVFTNYTTCDTNLRVDVSITS